MKNTRKRRSNLEFIKDCNLKHNYFYDYSKTDYKKLHDQILVICPTHGEFTQEANHHLRGRGCSKCAFNRNIKLLTDNTESFIEKAIKIHGNLYDYSKVVYGLSAHQKITLVCKKHGEFQTSPNSHLSKRTGCKKCGQLKTGWTKTTWKRACENRIAKLYIIRCFNENESFYKIGITCKDIKTRFGYKSQLPYNHEIVKLIESEDSDYIFSLERKLHKLNKEFKYKPEIFFDGFTECFSEIINYADCH